MTEHELPAERSVIAALAAGLRLRPLQLLALCALLVAAGPVWQMARMAASGVAGGVRIDTSGASGTISGGEYRLDLPVLVANGSPKVVFGVSLWVEAFACPSERSPTAACQRFASFEQYVPARIMPGSAQTSTQTVSGGVASDSDGAVVRIHRKLQSVTDEQPSASGSG